MEYVITRLTELLALVGFLSMVVCLIAEFS